MHSAVHSVMCIQAAVQRREVLHAKKKELLHGWRKGRDEEARGARGAAEAAVAAAAAAAGEAAEARAERRRRDEEARQQRLEGWRGAKLAALQAAPRPVPRAPHCAPRNPAPYAPHSALCTLHKMRAALPPPRRHPRPSPAP